MGGTQHLLPDCEPALVSPPSTRLALNVLTLPSSIVYISIFVALQVCLSLDASSQFAQADGKLAASAALMKASGVFAFISGLLGFYTVLHYLCQDALPFDVPMGDTSRYFARLRQKKPKTAQ